MTNAREEYLARVRARLVAARDGGAFVESAACAPPAPAVVDRDVKPENVPAVVSHQSSPYSESTRPSSHLAEELGAIVTELSTDSLEVLLVVARRLARAEDRT